MDTRQQAGEVEARGAELAYVELVLILLGQRSTGHQRPHVGVGGVAEHLQVLDRGRADFVRVGFGAIEQISGQLVEVSRWQLSAAQQTQPGGIGAVGEGFDLRRRTSL